MFPILSGQSASGYTVTTIEEGVRRFVAWYRSYHGAPAGYDVKVAQ